MEQHAKRPCMRGSTSSKEEEEEEKVVEDTAASDKEEEMEEETKDDTDIDEYVLVEPRRFMTDEEILEHRRQVIESDGFDVERFEGRLPGSIKPYKLTEARCPPLIGFSKQALKVYNENNKTKFEFYELKKANSQGVAGVMFYITFEAISGDIIGTFRARVWKKIMNQGSQVMSCERHL
ncbi:hypothetical protein HN51_056499 [Arachis hypogaea]|uniref:UPF0725 protein At1g23960 n=1 Tax=Arachis ipaensis TaxID=130454 RepID=UPI0007AF9927|nr:UPF0725 protein At1g23960 [Arachis ipaensis]XP_025679901.1 UPF0725 protein At1g23960 [Arachis hypogaea]